MDCHTPKNVLHTYCYALGQIINHNKSGIYFNSNFSPDDRQEILDFFNIPVLDSPGKYLGLHSSCGRSKKQALLWLKERIQAKLASWKEKMLSPAGKKVLIKAVVQAIPLYAMFIFKLPASYCSEINSIVAKFWWAKARKTGLFIGQNGKLYLVLNR